METQAKIEKNIIPITYSERDGMEFLTIRCPDGWEDVKKICKKVLTYENKRFTFTGWNSDVNNCYFRRSESFAKIS